MAYNYEYKKVEETNPVGRPLKYTSAADMQDDIDLYFIACRFNRLADDEAIKGLSDEQKESIKQIEELTPIVSGLAYWLDMATETLRAYGLKDEYSATIKRAKQRIEMSLEQSLAGTAVTGSIFNLKNNFGWKDKTETDLTSGGKAIKNDWHIYPVTTHAKD